LFNLKRKVKPIDIIEALEADNIESRPIWKPMHMQPFYKDCDYIGGDVSNKIFENGICLPSDTKMTDEDLERVVIILRKLW
jgi:dTDP-4-amino-4,6-dideoxygalactose transaminase